MNILAISFAYPPTALPRSIQVARLLTDLDADLTLFCADWIDATLDNSIYPNADKQIERIERVNFSTSKASRFGSRILYRTSRSAWNRIYRNPDKFKSWIKPVLEKVTKLTKTPTHHFDCIVSFGQPFSCHLIGLELKMRLQLPWIAYFSDPWTDNQYNEYDEHSRFLNLKLEASVVESADLILMNSIETIDLVFSKYAKSLKTKARVLPHAYDASLYGDRTLPISDRIVIRHIGEFYGPRSPLPLLHAIIESDTANDPILNNISFELVGDYETGPDLEKLTSHRAARNVKFQKRISYLESLNLMNRSDGLLLIDAPGELSVFLPSKLIDYIGSGRPIFGITPSGTADRLIKELGGVTANPSDIGSIRTQMAIFIDQIKNRKSLTSNEPWGEPSVRDRFDRRTVQRQFLELLLEATSKESSK